MATLEEALATQRAAATAFRGAALAVADAVWNVPRAPGKWSPAQVTDHVGRSTRVARDAMMGRAAMRGFPAPLQWLARVAFFNRVLAKGFPARSKAPAGFAPAHEPLPRAGLVERLDAEIDAFDADARGFAPDPRATFPHPVFGRIAIADYVMFNALHLDHHREQLPGGAPTPARGADSATASPSLKVRGGSQALSVAIIFSLVIGASVAGWACASAPATVVPLTNASIAPSLGVDLATFTRTPEGLYYKDVTVGTGAEAMPASRVKVAYRMVLANGTPVDSAAALRIRLRGGDPIIQGWRIGIPGMKVGGSRILVIPPELGYEWRAVGPIPPNSTLLFRVQLLDVE